MVCRHLNLRGGQSRIAWELALRALGENRDVHLVARRFSPEINNLNFQVHRVFQLPAFFGNGWRFRSFANFSSRRAFSLAQAGGIVHGFGDSYRQHILTLGNVDWNYPKYIPGRVPSTTALFVKKQALLDPNLQFLVLVSHQMRRDVLDLFPDFDQTKMRVIYPGIDPARFMKHSKEKVRNTLHNKFGIPLDSVWLVFGAGGDFEKRNLSTLTKALLKLQDHKGWKILFLGAKQGEVPWPRELGDRVYFIGRIDDVGTVLPGCDLMVYPAWYDEFAMMVSEAMASGLPVVVSRNVGAKEVLPDINRDVGVLNENDNSDLLAGLIKNLINDGPLRQRISIKNRESSKMLAWDSIYQQYRLLYEEVSQRMAR